MAMRLLLALLALLASENRALADEATWLSRLTQYEQNHVLRACAEFKLHPLEPSTEQKIDFIRIYRYPVMVDFEDLPTFPNRVHILTKESLIQREVLVKTDQAFDPNKIAETIRNLRSLGIFAVVAAIPVTDRGTGQTGLIVVTRDLWSLRLETSFQFTGSNVDRLRVQLTERNLVGHGKMVLGRFELDPFILSTGGLYLDPRLLSKKLRLQISGDAIFLRGTEKYDGFKTFVSLDKPFYSLDQRWGFSSWIQLQEFGGRHTAAGQLLTYDDPTTMATEALPRQWDSATINSEATARIQYGRRYIFRGGVGLGVLDYTSDLSDQVDLDGVAPETIANYRREVIPEGQRWVYPVLNASVFSNRFKTYRNLAGYALSEDVQLGISTGGYLRLPLKTLGSSLNMASFGGRIEWREALLGDGLIELAAGAGARYRDERGELSELSSLMRIRVASPSLGFGRFVSRTDWLRYLDWRAPPPITLGGDNGLRGYPSQNFIAFGGHRLRTNIEYRSAPIRLANLRTGVVAFYDAGVLEDGLPVETGLLQSVGVGLRMVVPQASSRAYRFDFGVPVDGSGFMVTITGETNQAVPITPAEDYLFANAISVGGLASQP
jgi:hypothetical protein